jgi:hypothetical protein
MENTCLAADRVNGLENKNPKTIITLKELRLRLR